MDCLPAGNRGLIPVWGSSPGEGKGYPFQDSGLENPTDCIVHGGRKESDTTERLSLSLSLPIEPSGKSICMSMCAYFIDRFVFVQNQAVHKVHTTYTLITACKTSGKTLKKTIDDGYSGK